MRKPGRRIFICSCITLSALVAPNISAQGLMLEEVVVTATKREVGMQDVPIALSVMTAEKIGEQGIGSIEHKNF